MAEVLFAIFLISCSPNDECEDFDACDDCAWSTGADTLLPSSISALGPDLDGDGFSPTGGNCDDSDPTIYQGAPGEFYDGIAVTTDRNNCNGYQDVIFNIAGNGKRGYNGFYSNRAGCNTFAQVHIEGNRRQSLA